METLSIQIWKKQNHPLVLKAFDILWNDKSIPSLGAYRINDKESRVNFAMNCKSGAVLWKRIGKKFNKLPGFKKCAVVTCVKGDDWINTEVIYSAFDDEGSA